MSDEDVPPEAADEEAEEKPAPDALSRLVDQLAEEKIIQPSLADFLR